MTVPLDQVVQQGIVMGLGEQTLLMRPDGYVRAIAGCATPIRDAQGLVQGLVLVVRDILLPGASRRNCGRARARCHWYLSRRDRA